MSEKVHIMHGHEIFSALLIFFPFFRLTQINFKQSIEHQLDLEEKQ